MEAEIYPWQRFGKLTVTSLAVDHQYRRKRKWHYTCDCGAVGVVGEGYALSPHKSEAKCCRVTEKRKHQVAPGSVIGNQTILELIVDHKIQTYRYWSFVCNLCGETGKISESSMFNARGWRPRCCNNGAKKPPEQKRKPTILSNKEKAERQNIPLFRSGAMIGLLRVIKMIDDDVGTNYLQRRYLTDCSCGKEKIFTEEMLVEGQVKSCGCMQKIVCGQVCSASPWAKVTFPPNWGQRKPLNEVML